MREVLIARLLEVLYWHGTPCYGSMRWKVVFEYIAILNGIDPDTKAGRKQTKELDLKLTDFSTFTDEQLIHFFELVVRRANVCM